MRKFLLASSALAIVLAAGSADAADLRRPVYKAPPPVAPLWSWTGWYVGVHVGGSWGTKEWSDPVFFFDGKSNSFPDLTVTNYGVNGFLGGGQIGYNFQSGWVVWGVEAQASIANIRGSDECFFLGKTSCRTKIDALGSFAVRLGGAVDRALLYVKGGVAWAHEKHSINGTFSSFDSFGTFTTEDKRWRWGAMVGAGIEYAFTSNVSGKIEYNYMDFGKRTYSFTLTEVCCTGDPLPVDIDIRQNLHLIKVGLNWRWDVGKYPVSARY